MASNGGNNGSNVKIAKLITPQLQLNNTRKYIALKGGLVNSIQLFPAPNVSNSSLSIQCNPPSPDIAVSRNVLKHFKWNVTITGTNTSGSPTLLQDGFNAPRSWPIISTTAVESFTINNVTVNQNNMNLYWKAFLWYADKLDSRIGEFSLTQSALDKYQNYADGVGAANNPLNSYASSGNIEPGRSSVGYTILTNTATSATIQIESTEPVLISPFAYGSDAKRTPALIGVNSMTYNCTFSNINRVMSLIVNQGITGVNITNVTANLTFAELEFLYITPDPTENIPRTLVSSYYTVTDYPTSSNLTFAPGQTYQIPMSSIQLPGVPRRLVIFASENSTSIANDTLGALSDSYLSFAEQAPLTMTWNNNQYFASYTQQNLYNIAKENGLNMTYGQWCGQIVSGNITGGQIGSVLVLEFGKDIGLPADLAPGVQGTFQLQLNCNFSNTNPTRSIVNPTLHILVIQEGVFSIDNGFANAHINVLTNQDVINATSQPGVSYEPPTEIYGGLFEGFSNVLSQLNPFLKNSKILSSVAKSINHPLAQFAAPVVDALGYGQKPKKKKGKGLKYRVQGKGMNMKRSNLISSDEETESSEEYY